MRRCVWLTFDGTEEPVSRRAVLVTRVAVEGGSVGFVRRPVQTALVIPVTALAETRAMSSVSPTHLVG